jgi:hypothetical protein
LPNRYVPEGLDIGHQLEVFVYTDSQGRLISTTLEPKIVLHEFAYLQVTNVTQYGAFMDWGIAKELLVPFREQGKKLKTGQWAVIYLYYDEVSERLVGSAKVHKWLDNDNLTVEEGDAVEVLVYNETDLGYKVVVNNLHDGLIYKNEVFQKVYFGDRMEAFVKKIRGDGKLDLQLEPIGYNKVEPNAQHILQSLKNNDGWLPLTDKSSPEDILNQLSMSKKTFKKAIGNLYKNKLIDIQKDGIKLL